MTRTYYNERAGERWLLQPTRRRAAEAKPSPADLAAKQNEDGYTSALQRAVAMLERTLRAVHDISRFDADGFGVDAAERFYVVREDLDHALGKFDIALDRLIPDVVPNRGAASETPSEPAADVDSDVQVVDLDRPEPPVSPPVEIHVQSDDVLLEQLQASVDRARGPRPGPPSKIAVQS